MNECRNCKFFFNLEKPSHLTDEERAKLPQIGQCRRRAPAVGFVALPKMSVEAGGLVPGVERCTAFPTVHDDAGCGEHEPRIENTH
jgi:hypothetical protein